MSSKWNHRICERCWFDGPGKVDDVEGYLRGRIPTRVTDIAPALCCYCAGITILGIFRRDNPNNPNLACQGDHDDDDD